MEPTTGYADLGDERIAYQVIGDGPLDIIVNIGFWGAFDVEWEDPMVRLFYQQIAEFARVVRFDRRGTGASDPLPLDALPPWESFAEELEAVMDAVGSESAGIVVAAMAGPAGMLFAATRPERVRGLILYQTAAKGLASEDYPFGPTREEAMEIGRQIAENWGTGADAALFFPSRGSDPEFQRWYAKYQRSITSPRAIQRYVEAALEADARSILPSIDVPTLIIHRSSSLLDSIDHGRYLAEHIKGSRLVELPGADGAPYWEYPELTISAIEEFLTGIRTRPAGRRQLASVMFTDIVESTRRAEKLGDRRWRALLDIHDDIARSVIGDHGGQFVKSTGDGVLATFDGPGRAIRSATGLRTELRKVELDIRSGIHIGEIETRGEDVGGVAVHLAARVMGVADPGEILVSSTVHDLVLGSDIVFLDRGGHSLKGIEGKWHLYAIRA